MKRWLNSPHLPLIATVLVLTILFTTASLLYEGFFSIRVVSNLLADNASLGIAAVGMTFVILAGGIDLSVGAVLAFTTIFIASMVEKQFSPFLAIPMALGIGSLFGAAMGFVICKYDLPAFLVTLGGMFFARGMAFVMSKESLGISHPVYDKLQEFGIPLTERVSLPSTAILFVAIFIAGVFLAHLTRFGKNVYAIGGNETSARLMGLPVFASKILVYTLSGFCSALAGVVSTIYKGSGNPADGMGFELDVIASVVIGGTLLTGGIGTLAGTLTGVLIFGTIQTALNFDGRLNSSWLRIAMGVLLMLFILFQKFLTRSSSGADISNFTIAKAKPSQ